MSSPTPSSTLCPFERLPNEILNKIILSLRPSFFVVHNGYGQPPGFRMVDTLNLMRSSRRFYEFDIGGKLWENLFLDFAFKLSSLARACIDRPDLQYSIKVLRLTQGDTTPLFPSATLHANWIRATFGDQNWDLRRRPEVWHKMLTLTVLQNAASLEELQIDFTEKGTLGMMVYDYVFRSIYAQRTIPKLRTLCFFQRENPQRREISIRVAYPFLKHSNITTFYGEHIIEAADSRELDEDVPLETLVLKASYLRSMVFDNILEHCLNLRVLTYEHEAIALPYQVRYKFFPGEMAMSLRRVKSTLRELNIYRLDVHGITDSPHTMEEFLTVGSLKSLGKLEKLSITADLLLGTEDRLQIDSWYDASIRFPRVSQSLIGILPSSIEFIELVDCAHHNIVKVESFLEYHHSHLHVLPNFKRLAFTYTDTPPIGSIYNNIVHDFRMFWAGQQLFKQLVHWHGLGKVEIQIILRRSHNMVTYVG